MVAFEIIKPGNWLNHYKVNEWNFKISNLLDSLIDAFIEANQSLNLFDSEYNEENRFDQNEFEKDRIERTNIEKELRIEIGDDLFYKNYSKYSFEVDVILNRRKVANGILPKNLKTKNIFIFSKSFLFSLDNFQKIFKSLRDQKEIPYLPRELGNLYIEFCENFKTLKGVRDSAHHLEDRIQGLQFGKPIKLKPIDNGSIKVNGAIVLNQLSNRRYGNVLSNGKFGEVEISQESLKKVQITLQRILNVFDWKGLQEYYPK